MRGCLSITGASAGASSRTSASDAYLTVEVTSNHELERDGEAATQGIGALWSCFSVCAFASSSSVDSPPALRHLPDSGAHTST